MLTMWAGCQFNRQANLQHRGFWHISSGNSGLASGRADDVANLPYLLLF